MPKVTLSQEEVEYIVSWLKRKRTLEAKKHWMLNNSNVDKISNRIKLLENLK